MPWKRVVAIGSLFIGVVLVWLAFLATAPKPQGSFGEWLDAASVLFSALAFAALIVALWLQKEELALQRQELADTRAELRKAANAQEHTEQAMREQVYVAALTAALNATLERNRGITGVPSGRLDDRRMIIQLLDDLSEQLNRSRDELR